AKDSPPPSPASPRSTAPSRASTFETPALPRPPAQNHALVESFTRVFGSSRVLAQRTSFFGSRKLRLAPQDYSPWTPPSDRFLVRSYPPASRHPRVLDLVGFYHGVQCHPERSEPASEVEGSASCCERRSRGSFAS